MNRVFPLAAAPALLGGFLLAGCASAGQPVAMKPAYARRQSRGQVSMFKAAPAETLAVAAQAPEAPAAAAETAPEPSPEPAEAPKPPRRPARAAKNEIDDQVMP